MPKDNWKANTFFYQLFTKWNRTLDFELVFNQILGDYKTDSKQ